MAGFWRRKRRGEPPPEAAPRSERDPADPEDPDPEDVAVSPARAAAAKRARRRVQQGIMTISRWTLRGLVIAAGLVVLAWLIGQFWSVLLPVFFALLLSTVLWPPVRWLRRHMPPALAALLGLLGFVAVFGGIIAVIAPLVASQGQSLVDRASAGLDALQAWLAGPPFNLGPDALGGLIDRGIQELQQNSQQIAGIVLTSLGTIGSAVITLVLALVLTFFFLKDGPRFLPWLRTWIGVEAGRHFTVVSERVWRALGQYVWSQAAVALMEGTIVGLGVWILQVPFALPIAVLTFFGGFIPIVGAFVAGAFAILIALVSNGFWTAVAVLAIILLVNQLEGNVLQPFLVGRTLKIHPAVVLGAVALGGTLFGIIGAFLAVPAVAAVQVIMRYIREQVEKPPDGVRSDATPIGSPQAGGTAPGGTVPSGTSSSGTAHGGRLPPGTAPGGTAPGA